MRFITRIRFLLRYSAEEFFEFFLGTTLTLWGISLFFPTHSNLNPTPSKIVLSLVANQHYFALVATLIGATYLTAIFLERLTLQKWTNLAITFFWTFIATIYFANNFTSTNFVLYGLLAIFSALTFLRKND